MPRPSSATDSRKPTPRTAPALHDDAAGARVAHGVGQRFLRDADDLALDAGVEGGSSSIASSIGTSVVRCARSAMRCSAAATSSRSLRLRPQRRHRSARLDQVRARQIDGRLEAARGRRRQADPAAALRRLQLHQDRAEALRQRVVDVARDAVALLEHRLAALFEPALIGQPAVVERQRRLPRRGFEQRAAPAPLALGIAARSTAPSSRASAAAARSGATSSDVDAGRRD